jgi:hypothetical protein
MNYWIGACATACLTLLSCSQFPTQLGYIDGSKSQPVGFVFSPYAEGAPGDTISLKAYFAGDSLVSFTCSLSTHYEQSPYGSDTAYGFVSVNDPKAILSAQALSLSFVVPRDYFANNPVNIGAITAGLSFQNWTIDSVSAFLTTTDFSHADSATCLLAARLSQLITGKIVLHIAINGGFTITRSITVGYDTHIKGNRYVFVNKNPTLNWIGIYKIKGTASSFEPGPNDTLICLYAADSSAIPSPRRFSDTVGIDKGYVYYAVADSGGYNGTITRDSSRSNSGVVGYENYSYLWFYQSDPTEAQGVDPQNQLIIDNGARNYYAQLSPPLNCAIQHAKIWVRVSDSFDNEANRPIGVSLYEMNVVLAYSDAYRKNPGNSY